MAQDASASSDVEAALLSYNDFVSSSSDGDQGSNHVPPPSSSSRLATVSSPSTMSYLFISFLALVQSISVDFLPITWHAALAEARRGGTAQLQQMAIDLQSAFAFKKPSPLYGHKGPKQLQALTTEVSVLGHPAVRKCENVIALEGIAWDVEHKTGQVWPVLVFQKAAYGDLMAFVQKGEGRDLVLRERLELFGDVLAAVTVLHENYVVHGDIKPQNVLVFHGKDSKTKYVAKLADFGYSSILVGEDATFPVRGTKSWTAPEYVRGTKVAFEAARRMDVFSLGCLCSWLLFYNTSETGNDTATSSLLPHHQAHAKLINAALEHVQVLEELDDEVRQNLTSFFEQTLQRKPDLRTVECRNLLGLINPRRAHDKQVLAPAKENEGHVTSQFKISKSLSQLLLADYRVRQYIFRCLKDVAELATLVQQHHGAYDAYNIELALCYKIGFGADVNEAALETLMKEVDVSDAVLEKAIAEIAECSEGPQFHNLIYRDLVEAGKDFRVDFDTTHQLEGHLEDAIERYTKDLKNLRVVFGPTHILALVVTTALCYALRTAGDWDAAIALRIEVTEIFTETNGEHSSDTLSSKSQLAAMYIDLDQWERAEKILLEVREAQLRITKTEAFLMIETAQALAEVYRRKGKWKEAEALILPALQERERSLGRTHPDTLRLVSKVASLYMSLQRYPEAQSLLEELVESRQVRLGNRHHETLSCMSNLATVYLHEGKLQEAEELYRHVEAVRMKILGEEHKATLIVQSNLASLYKQLSKYNEAEALEQRVLKVKISKFGEVNRSTLVTQGNLALTYAYQKKWKEACSLGQEVVNAKRKVVGPDHPDTVRSICNLAEAYVELQQTDEAKKLLSQGLQDALDAGRAGEYEVELLEGWLYQLSLDENQDQDASY